MKAYFITLFPEIIEVSVNSGITGKAIKTSLIDVETLNPRKFLAANERVDDKIYGGGPGMLLKAQPINDAIKEIKEKIPGKSKVIFLSPRGKVFNQEKAKKLSNEDNLIFICGRYEGIDQRIVNSLVDEEISIGDFILSGGEIPALAVFDSIIRNIEGVLGDNESLLEESFNEDLLEYPHFTRPEEMSLGKVPEELLSGNHERIEIWRKKQSLGYTALNRMDLIKNKKLDKNEKSLIREFFDELNVESDRIADFLKENNKDD